MWSSRVCGVVGGVESGPCVDGVLKVGMPCKVAPG